MAKAKDDGSVVFDIGDRMPDDSIFAGLTEDTEGKPHMILTIRRDFFAISSEHLEKNNRKAPWELPTAQELKTMLQNREKGALRDTFHYAAQGYLTSETAGNLVKVVSIDAGGAVVEKLENSTSQKFATRFIKRLALRK